MNRINRSVLITSAIFSAYWAYTIIDELLREFSTNVTFIDLASVFILGLLYGVGLGVAFGIRNHILPANW